MASSKKYAGLLDLDEAPEIYETPELTDDVSTVRSATVRTTSLSPSDEDGRHDPDAGLDKQHLDRNEARRRFERSLVDARDVNFSDSLASNRKSYKTTSRRRRRKENGTEELGDLSDSEDESLSRKLARLRRETEEVKAELEKRREEPGVTSKVDDEELEDGVGQLSHILDGLHASSRSEGGVGSTAEVALSRKLTSGPPKTESSTRKSTSRDIEGVTATSISPSIVTAVASFADRVTALETALGLSSISSTSESTLILPTLASLSAQITTLSTTLVSPTSTFSSRSTQPSSSSAQAPPASTLPHLDDLAARLRTLTQESDKLTQSRKSAIEALHALQEARLRQPHTSSYYHNKPTTTTTSTQIAPKTDTLSLIDDSHSKIAALYATLPTIQDLAPLLPVVLERLRSLHAVHAGAATAKADLDGLERQVADIAKDVDRWSKGLDSVERQVGDAEAVMKGNADVIGSMVRRVEERLTRLEDGG